MATILSQRQCVNANGIYRLLSNISCTSDISRTLTLGILGIPSPNFLWPSVWPKPPIQGAPWVLTLECRLLTNCEVDPLGPSDLRFWLAMDQWTNDTSSVSGVCEAYYISTCCEPLYPKCNCICFNKSKNMTLPGIFTDTSTGFPTQTSWKIIEIQICFNIIEKSLNFRKSSWNL